jgi:hypothetical protein
VQDLRTVLGANNSTGSSESRGNLAEYADFKRRAIKPAIDEINKKTDLSLGFREFKRPGSKAIDRLVFSIRSEPAPELEVLQPPPLPQLEFALETEPEDQLLLQECMNRYGLSESQRSTLQNHYAKRGVAYIREKMIVVDQEPRQNAAKAFLAALRDDWKPKIQTVKPPPPPKKKRVEPKPEEPPATDEERAQTSAKLRQFIQTLRASR